MRDKVVVVSGTGPGLGHDLARSFARTGARMVLLARSTERVHELRQELAAAGTTCIAVPTDITRASDCDRVRTEALQAFGRIDVLINNAFQLGPLAPLASAALDEEWRAALDTNLIGTLQLTQALVPALAASRGNVVMINTAAMRDIRPGFGSYAISKGALQTATRYLAQELGPQGVRVNSLVPSYIDGPPLRDAFAAMAQARGVSTDTVIEEACAALPLRFIPTGEDVARAALFLASDDARAITGASLDVNAGRYIPI